MRAVLMSAAALALIAAPARAGWFAQQSFAAYEGQDALQEGRGGTKVTTDGVDFWTSGAPPHRYRIIGVLNDDRSAGIFGGSATGAGMAKHIRELGGDAVIIMGRDSRVTGAMVNQYGATLARRNSTAMLVVKYEP